MAVLSLAKATIFSLSGLELTENEHALFREAQPLGFILFGRNCESPDQLRALTDSLRDLTGRECPILIDQEGGRVQRLKPPVWRKYPPMKTYGDEAEVSLDSALADLRYAMLQLSEDLHGVGVNVNCAPVLDVLSAATHEAIGDRAFSDDADIVARLGLCACHTMLSVGVQPVVKHLPGHGRAVVDSHYDLPVVNTKRAELEMTDFAPFREIALSDVGKKVWGMVAHVIYSDIDPDHPATVSHKVISEIIRGSIGFKGLLLSDDLDMKALDRYGDVAARAKLSLEAGCDVALYCSGVLADMEAIAGVVPVLEKEYATTSAVN